jgi:hypothetical protein
MTKISRIVATTAAVAFMFAAGASAEPEDTQGEAARMIVGTWRVQITLRDCTSGQPLRSPFPALASFARGGTVTTADGGLSPASRTTGLGVWSHSSGGTYAAVTEAFLFAPTGVNAGTQRITQHIELNPYEDTFQATVNSTILDTQGNVVAVGCATSVGRRLN